MSSDMWTCIASGEAKVKTAREIMYIVNFFVGVVSKKCRRSLDVHWRADTR